MTAAPARPLASPVVQPGSVWLPRVLLANLVIQVLLIVTGGLVRVSGSGLGCPSWPQCVPGSLAPVQLQPQGWHKYVEFGNRTLVSLVSIAAIAVLYAVWRWAGGRRDLMRPAWVVLGGVAAQALLGGLTVRSVLSPITVSAHFLLSICLVAASAYLVFRLPEPSGPRPLVVPALVERLGWASCAVAAVVLVLGTVVTGSGPHSGDAKAPARYGFDLRTVAWLHADSVMLFCGLAVAVWIATRLSATTTTAASAWVTVLVVTLAQGVVGYTQYFTGVPGGLVLVHMLLASLLVIALTRAMVRLRAAS